MDSLLRLDGVTQRFGGLVAVDNLSLQIGAHRITGLIGPNGAGKTTVFHLITGFQKPASGRIYLKGRDITGIEPSLLTRLGLARTFQTAQLFKTLTVRQTLEVACSAAGNAKGTDDALALAKEIGLHRKLDFYPSELTTADMQAIELMKALATGADLILLDEVFAGLNPSEIDKMVELIKSLIKTKTFVIIEHRMRAVMALCEYIHVLVNGCLAASGMPGEVTQNPEVIKAYLGEGVGRA